MSEPFVIHAGHGTPADTLMKAIAALPEDDSPAIIRLTPGIYREKVVLARPNTTVEGEDAATTRIVWGDAATDPMDDGLNRGTFRTATLRTDAHGITLRRLTIENDAAPRERVGQCIALYADGDQLLVEDCVLLGHQDTLFTAPLPPREMQKNGFIGPKQCSPRVPQRHTYRRCRIEGDVDFIFGSAAAWFEDCDIVTVDGREDRSAPFTAYCTAASTPEGQAFGYVFKSCRFTAVDCPRASVYLGRPWRDFAKTVLIGCELGAHIRPAGFDDWGKPHAHATMLYGEYGSTGEGAKGERAPYAHRLTDEQAAQYTYENFMASLG